MDRSGVFGTGAGGHLAVITDRTWALVVAGAGVGLGGDDGVPVGAHVDALAGGDAAVGVAAVVVTERVLAGPRCS